VTLAIFDLDNTLIGGDSDHAWGEFVAEEGLVAPDIHRQQNDRFYEDYKNGCLDMEAYLAFALSPIVGRDSAELKALHERFMDSKIKPLLLPKAQALLDSHRERGHFLLIITATNRFITDPIATLLGVDDMLATEPECVDGMYTGRMVGVPCFQDGKVTRLKAWLEEHPHVLEGSYFYSDSHNDLPLLEQVDNPVAVDADERLQALAESRGWQWMSLRDAP